MLLQLGKEAGCPAHPLSIHASEPGGPSRPDAWSSWCLQMMARPAQERACRSPTRINFQYPKYIHLNSQGLLHAIQWHGHALLLSRAGASEHSLLHCGSQYAGQQLPDSEWQPWIWRSPLRSVKGSNSQPRKFAWADNPLHCCHGHRQIHSMLNTCSAFTSLNHICQPQVRSFPPSPKHTDDDLLPDASTCFSVL